MQDVAQQIDELNLTLFDAIPSQTSQGDKRSLLAIQAVTAQKHREFAYLEIGSHLGGSIQPYLLDDRCKKIYSIDPRPLHQPDDRSPGYVAHYDENSSERMLALLKEIGQGDIEKIECIESDASEVEPTRIEHKPEVLLIDGEHTKTAVLTDCEFCLKVASNSGTMVFHDFNIIYPAIFEFCRRLRGEHREYLPVMLEGNVFAIFFDADKVKMSAYLSNQYENSKRFLPRFKSRLFIKRILPGFVLNAVRKLRS